MHIFGIVVVDVEDVELVDVLLEVLVLDELLELLVLVDVLVLVELLVLVDVDVLVELLVLVEVLVELLVLVEVLVELLELLVLVEVLVLVLVDVDVLVLVDVDVLLVVVVEQVSRQKAPAGLFVVSPGAAAGSQNSSSFLRPSPQYVQSLRQLPERIGLVASRSAAPSHCSTGVVAVGCTMPSPQIVQGALASVGARHAFAVEALLPAFCCV